MALPICSGQQLSLPSHERETVEEAGGFYLQIGIDPAGSIDRRPSCDYLVITVVASSSVFEVWIAAQGAFFVRLSRPLRQIRPQRGWGRF